MDGELSKKPFEAPSAPPKLPQRNPRRQLQNIKRLILPKQYPILQSLKKRCGSLEGMNDDGDQRSASITTKRHAQGCEASQAFPNAGEFPSLLPNEPPSATTQATMSDGFFPGTPKFGAQLEPEIDPQEFDEAIDMMDYYNENPLSTLQYQNPKAKTTDMWYSDSEYSDSEEDILEGPGNGRNKDVTSKLDLNTDNMRLKDGIRRDIIVDKKSLRNIPCISDNMKQEQGAHLFTQTSEYQLTSRSFVCQNKDKSRHWQLRIKVELSHNSTIIGFATGSYIQRNIIPNFRREIETTGSVALRFLLLLFGRYGRLRKEYKEHCKRKGSGVWGGEMDRGDLFVIDTLFVEHRWKKSEKLAKIMIQSLMDKSCTDGRALDFVLVDSNVAISSGEDLLVSGGVKAGRDQSPMISLLRSLGFRRVGLSQVFGKAMDPAHLCYTISEDEDRQFDAKCLNEEEQSPDIFFKTGPKANIHIWNLERSYFLHWATMKYSEDRCIEIYKRVKNHLEFGCRDSLLRNVLHVAAWEKKPKCVRWLLDNVKRRDDLLSARTSRGYTPLEELEAQLEVYRSSTKDFDGFSKEAVMCLAALRNLRELDSMDRRRLRFGCTCGGCIQGFMSSRVAFALVCEAAKLHFQLKQNLDDGDTWIETNASVVHYIKPNIQANLKLNSDLRGGFANLFYHADAILSKGLELTTRSIKHSAWNRQENKSQVPGVLFLNGTTEAAIQALFDIARDQDEWAGNNTHDKVFKEDLNTLHECRNDHEWDLVLSQSILKPLDPVDMF